MLVLLIVAICISIWGMTEVNTGLISDVWQPVNGFSTFLGNVS